MNGTNTRVSIDILGQPQGVVLLEKHLEQFIVTSNENGARLTAAFGHIVV